MLGRGSSQRFRCSPSRQIPHVDPFIARPRVLAENLIYRRHNAEILARVDFPGNDEYVPPGDTGGINIQVSCRHLMVVITGDGRV